MVTVWSGRTGVSRLYVEAQGNFPPLRSLMATPYVEEGPEGLVFVDEDGHRLPAYLMKAALERAGISESTFYRWIRSGRAPDVKLRNRANWRIFTDGDIDRLRAEVGKLGR